MTPPLPSTDPAHGPTLDVIGFGAMNLDEIAVVPRIVVDGETRVRELRRQPGGSAANTVYALAKLGMTTGYVGAVGDDAEGRALVADLTSVGVDTRRVAVKPDVPSGLVRAIADSTHRSLYVYPGANDLLSRSDVHLSYLSRARVLHLTSFVNPRQLALQGWAVRRLPPSIQISFSPGSIYAERGIAALRTILVRTTVLFVNGDEARRITGRKDLHSAADTLLRLGCRTVVITLGAGQPAPSAKKVRAACLVTDGRVEEVVPPIVRGRRVVDSVGAGDAFAAGFLFGFLRDRELRDCAHLGQLVASCSLRAAGARVGLPTHRELREAYRRHCGSPLHPFPTD
ncbi:MAG TPA: PfkB family carbohydrate kinase [Candidatus Methylomirabilis sp.]|nr:PfkB family carbohydrate kinase [Candidatus Methylomirabilis sp.]